MIMKTIGRALSHREVKFYGVELSYPAPLHHALYREHLSCEPRFNRPLTRVTFESPHLDFPLPGRDEAFNQLCQQHCSKILRQLVDNADIKLRLKNLLFSTPGHIPTLEAAARELQLSMRTLRRRLQEVSSSYQRIVDKYRIEIAKEHLASSQCSIKEIAICLDSKTRILSADISSNGQGKQRPNIAKFLTFRS